MIDKQQAVNRTAMRRGGQLFSAALLLGLVISDGCNFMRKPVYRADVELLVTVAGNGAPSSDLIREDDDHFFETARAILLSQTMQRRVAQTMKLNLDEFRRNLTRIEVAQWPHSDILVVSVDSPSRDFARDCANTFGNEYLRYRDELRARTAESVLLALERETSRLADEVKSANDRLADYAKSHPGTNDVESGRLQSLRDDYERVRGMYNDLLAQLMKIDVYQGFSARQVSVLESAIVEDRPVRCRKHCRWHGDDSD